MSLAPFRIISWDVGIIHLAYCILEISHFDGDIVGSKKKPKIKIIDWDEINLIEDDRISLTCSGHKAIPKSAKGESEGKICGNNARFYVQPLNGSEMLGYCKTHLSQYADQFDDTDIEKLFVENNNKSDGSNICYTCSFEQRNGKVCGKKSKYSYTGPDNSDSEELYLCSAHYKSELVKKKKMYSPQPIKNLIVKKYPTAQLQLNLMIKLDALVEHFAKLNIKEVVIENQPAFKNPKMKSIANTLFDYFMMRGIVDKIYGLDINMIKMMAPCNKLKINNDNTIAVFKKNKDDKKKYKLTKDLGIQYTKKLLENDPDQLEYLDLYKKKDDMCDAYLQGRYYLEIYRKKNITSLEKNFNKSKVKSGIDISKLSNSKSSKPSKSNKSNKSRYTSGSKNSKLTKPKSTKSVVIII